MLPGATIVRKCSACGKLIAQPTLLSGNTFGARFWTDGKREAPMLPDQPWLVTCPHCEDLVWIDEQEQIKEIEPGGPRDHLAAEAGDLRPYAVPSMHDYLALLAAGVADTKKEHYLRLRAWWAGNDARRQGATPKPMSDEETANLQAFAPLLDESDENDRIMKAAVMRELGRYEDATALLQHTFSDTLAQAAGIIRTLAAQRTPFVSEIKFK